MGLKKSNEYVSVLQHGNRLYEKTPKAVFAAIAYSYAQTFGSSGEGSDETIDPEEVERRLIREWELLHENGIVLQKAPAFTSRIERDCKAEEQEERLIAAGVLEPNLGPNDTRRRE